MTRTFGRRSVPVIELSVADVARAAVAPTLGANLFQWQTRAADGARVDRIDTPAGDDWVERPTRGGVPVLFPFPNRIRDGRFRFAGGDYRLPANDAAGVNAIHGFAPRVAWTVVDHGLRTDRAFVELEYRASRAVPNWEALWPADQQLRLRWELRAGSLRAELTIENPDIRPLPFGLGLHPYFTTGPGDRVTAFATARWSLTDCLPDGRVEPLDAAQDLRTPRPIDELTLDDVYTAIATAADDDGLRKLAVLDRQETGDRLTVRADETFRELVVFTPPRRKAICLEPYTCPTDAVNLSDRGQEVGWRVLPPGGRQTAVVQFDLNG